MLATLKKLSVVALAGAIVGAIVASLIAPRFIAWYVSPGAAGQALCSCPELAASVASQLLQAQLVGALIGAGVFFIVGILVIRRRMPKVKPPSQTDIAPPPTS
ncbi:MAG: hypothetical protein A2289_17625 [Deltaproteobacteria bacterium RIFOXYA12_FULL_58_15]|nr:MAG: hypothetical protein A2289_17625 [Deltaproteobacteria bacterium RIFOXYA12_FULL_58_15]